MDGDNDVIPGNKTIEERDWTRKRKMALDTVSHFFDNYRRKGQKGEESLQFIRENISKSIRKSSLGDCKLYFDLALKTPLKRRYLK